MKDAQTSTQESNPAVRCVLRVLQVGKYFPPRSGGIETVTENLFKRIPDQSVQMDVLCFSSSTRGRVVVQGSGTVIEKGVPFSIGSMAFSLGYVFHIVFQARHYDVLHVHFPNPLAAFALLFVEKNKIVVHWHSDIVKQKILKRFVAPFVRPILEGCACVVAPTKAHIEGSSDRKLISGKSRILPFVLDLDYRSPRDPESVERLRIKFGGKKILLCVGRHVGYKGFEVAIDALAGLDVGFVLVFVGEGPLTESYREQVTLLGVAERVFFLGKLSDEDLLRYYDVAFCLLLPSTTKAEMLGLVQLEAMARGVPVISSSIPGSGVQEINKHGRTGLLVRPGSKEELAGAIERLATDPELYKLLSDECRRFIAATYDFVAIATQYRALYAQIQSKQKGIPPIDKIEFTHYRN